MAIRVTSPKSSISTIWGSLPQPARSRQLPAAQIVYLQHESVLFWTRTLPSAVLVGRSHAVRVPCESESPRSAVRCPTILTQEPPNGREGLLSTSHRSRIDLCEFHRRAGGISATQGGKNLWCITLQQPANPSSPGMAVPPA